MEIILSEKHWNILPTGRKTTIWPFRSGFPNWKRLSSLRLIPKLASLKRLNMNFQENGREELTASSYMLSITIRCIFIPLKEIIKTPVNLYWPTRVYTIFQGFSCYENITLLIYSIIYTNTTQAQFFVILSVII